MGKGHAATNEVADKGLNRPKSPDTDLKQLSAAPAAALIKPSVDKIEKKSRAKREKIPNPLLDTASLSKNRKNLIEKNINGLPRLAEVLAGSEKADIEKLSVKTLMKLEKIYPGVLLYAFTDVIGSREKMDFDKWELYKKPIAGLKLKVDFHGNQDAFDNLGAGDILPPSVRTITVYSQDYKGRNVSYMQRTSTRRLGLKGQGNDVGEHTGNGNGFFDQEGYMPIFTGDEIIIGGNKNSKAGIDKSFSEMDQQNYEKQYGKADQEWLDKLIENDPILKAKKTKDPNFKFTKEYSQKDIQTIIEQYKNNPKIENLVKLSYDIVANLSRGIHTIKGKIIRHSSDCGKWVAQIWRLAGFSSNGRTVFNGQAHYPTEGLAGRDYRGHEANKEQIGLISGGDWIWYHNGNRFWRGLHSAMFLRWKDKENFIAECSSGDAENSWHIHDVNLNPNTLNWPKPSRKDGHAVVMIKKPFI